MFGYVRLLAIRIIYYARQKLGNAGNLNFYAFGR